MSKQKMTMPKTIVSSGPWPERAAYDLNNVLAALMSYGIYPTKMMLSIPESLEKCLHHPLGIEDPSPPSLLQRLLGQEPWIATYHDIVLTIIDVNSGVIRTTTEYGDTATITTKPENTNTTVTITITDISVSPRKELQSSAPSANEEVK